MQATEVEAKLQNGTLPWASKQLTLLHLVIIDRRSRRVVWENSVLQTFIGDLEREATDREIAGAVGRVLAEFPPQ